MTEKSLRICPNGHRYYKSSDCPVCPICEKAKQPEEDFLSVLGAPARRALENAGIDSIKKLLAKSEADLLKLHGFGPSSIPRIVAFLKQHGLSLNTNGKKK
jgi:DNA-directed RNA polymerase alpha subunit